jgi:hypothetical protein
MTISGRTGTCLKLRSVCHGPGLRIKNHSKVDLLRASTQADEFFHAAKGRYTDQRLNFMTSTEARVALGVIFKPRNPDWQDELGESLGIPPLLAECSKMLQDLESKRQQRNEERRQEPERRMRLRMG